MDGKEDKIEVTPEMIEAGAEVLLDDGLCGSVLSPIFARIVSKEILERALERGPDRRSRG